MKSSQAKGTTCAEVARQREEFGTFEDWEEATVVQHGGKRAGEFNKRGLERKAGLIMQDLVGLERDYRIKVWKKGIGPFYTSGWYVQISLEKDHSGCWVMPRAERGLKLGGLRGGHRVSWGEEGYGTGDGEEGTGSRKKQNLQQDWLRSMRQRQKSRMMLGFSVWVISCHLLRRGRTGGACVREQ